MTMTLTVEHLDIYETFVSKLLTRAEKSTVTRSLLGRPLCELAQFQYAAIQSAKAGTGELFDVLKAVKEFILSLYDYVKWMSEKGDEFCLQLQKDFVLLDEVFENKQRYSWMTDHGKFLLQRALDLKPVVAREAAVFALRTPATRAALIAACDSLTMANCPPANWKIALQAALYAFENYRFDFTSLTKVDGPCFVKRSADVAEMVRDIDGRIAAKAAAAEREAAERKAAERDEDDDTLPAYAHVDNPGYAPREHDQDSDASHEPIEFLAVPEPVEDYWTNWEPEYNPANGLPMVGHLDIHNNTWGSNLNDFSWE